jgi:hypothetical protein
MTKVIDWDDIDKMFVAGCNIEQTAAALGCSRDCLYARCLKEKNTTLSAYHQEKRAHGDAKLHAAQYEKACEDKNPTMLIWLGKQRLQQKDGEEIRLIPPNQDTLGKDQLIMEQAHEITELKANANKPQTE